MMEISLGAGLTQLGRLPGPKWAEWATAGSPGRDEIIVPDLGNLLLVGGEQSLAGR